jgi:hypothetical protein
MERAPTQQKESMHAQVRSPLYLPNAASTAQHIWTQALEFCAQKMALESTEGLTARLEHDRAARQYCLYGVAKQMAATLGDLVPEIKAIYTLDYDATPHDLCFSPTSADALPIHLIVWAERKTAALDALIASLDSALAQAGSEILGTHELVTLLDTQVIDDDQVDHQVGYGALLSSIHHRPIQVWSRLPGSGSAS